MPQKPYLNLVVIGHANSGKSTVAGHLLVQMGAVDKTTIVKYQAEAAKISKQGSEYAWVMDKLAAERKRGTTIDFSMAKFETKNQTVTLINIPGNVDFTKNMLTGASQANCALLVVDASEGGFEAGISKTGQTMEHLLMAHTFGITQLIVAVNKIDKVQGDKKQRYNGIVSELKPLLKNVGYEIAQVAFLPVSGLLGLNLTKPCEEWKWYEGYTRTSKTHGQIINVTLMDTIDSLDRMKNRDDRPLRIAIAHVYHVKTAGGTKTIPVGCIESGVLKPGMELRLTADNTITKAESVEVFHQDVKEAGSGANVGFHVQPRSDNLQRGQVVGDSNQDPPMNCASFVAQIIILSHPGEIRTGYTPVIDCHTAHLPCKLVEFLEKVDRSSGKTMKDIPKFIKQGEAALVKMVPLKPLCVEPFIDYPGLARFIIRDNTHVVGAGVIKSVEKARGNVIKPTKPAQKKK